MEDPGAAQGRVDGRGARGEVGVRLFATSAPHVFAVCASGQQRHQGTLLHLVQAVFVICYLHILSCCETDARKLSHRGAP